MLAVFQIVSGIVYIEKQRTLLQVVLLRPPTFWFYATAINQLQFAVIHVEFKNIILPSLVHHGFGLD